MLISINLLKKYVDLSDVSTKELVDLIGSRLVEVEEEIDLAEKYKGIKIVEVVTAEKLKGSDHLTVCQVNDGSKELVQVVCGAPNAKAGMLAVWLAPGVVLPETYNKEPLVLDKRKLMGVESAGMLAAMDELDLGSDHRGIVEINPDTAKPGDDFADVFELNDIILDIENKSLTHRPDCFGVIGFAREVAGILGQKFVEPDVFASRAKQSSNNHMDRRGDKSSRDDVKLEIEIVDSKLCPRYSAAVIDGASDKSSKYLNQIQIDIAKSGMRSIDRIVDITNYLMLLTGQPLHAFDYDKLCKVGGQKDAKIIVRAAKKGEKLELLDGKIIECSEKDILITSNNKPVALAGAMGGANTAIDENTKRIIIESATFDLFSMRGMQFRHGIFSEAITRFTKGQPAGLTMPVLCDSIDLIDGHVEAVKDTYPKPSAEKPIVVEIEKINGTLGTSYDFNDIVTTLENVGFKVKLDGENLLVKSPWWRTDVHIAEEVIEEVGRLLGFDNIPLDVPTRGFVAPKSDKIGEFKKRVRDILSESGCNEILTYSFVSERLLKQVGQDPKNSYKITNSISPKLQYIRQSLTPSILEKTWLNIKVPFEHFALFEINQVYQKSYGMTKENVPVLRDKVAFVVCDRKAGDDAYYEALRHATNLMQKLNIEFDIVPMTDKHASNAPFEPKRSSQIKTPDHKICFGVVGEFRQAVLKNLKLPKYTAGFELNIDKLMNNVNSIKALITDEPPVKNDITFKVGADLAYISLKSIVCDVLAKQSLWFECNPVSIWQGDDKTTKNISFNLSFASFDKALKNDEIADIMDRITSEVKNKLKGEVV